MSGIKLQKRDHDFFVSYGHADAERVEGLVSFLKHACGLKIWFDSSDNNASMRSAELLGDAIRNSRGAIFCVSRAWKGSTWCKNEYEVSLAEQRANNGFDIVCLRLDDVDPPAWFTVAEILDFRTTDGRSIGRLLRSLSSEVPRRFDNAEDVYVAAPWSRQSQITIETLGTLARTGWRLIGDEPNLKHLGEHRIEAIQRTARGVVAVLPYDPSRQPAATPPYILDEARLALGVTKPLLLLLEPGVNVPEDLRLAASACLEIGAGKDAQALLVNALEDFDEVLRHVDHDDTAAFIFFAASLRGGQAEDDDIASVIERSSNMRCFRGERLSGNNVQDAIVDLIRRAALMIADVSDDHRNTLIEAGIAIGSGTTLKLLCRSPPDGVVPKKRFMFEGREIHWYTTPWERLGLCYYFARQYRRRVYVIR